MALTSRKRYPNRVSRRKISGVGTHNDNPKRQEIQVGEVTAQAATIFTIGLDQPCSLTGIPNYVLTPDLAITAATLDGLRTTLTLIHATGVVTAVTIPFEDPAVRNQAGGYVRPGLYETT